MSESIITLDVREDLQQGREPFSRIMQAAADLKEGEKLLLIAPFEPTPLFHVMAQRGFRHEARQTSEGDWEVLFTRHLETFDSDKKIPSFQPPRTVSQNIINIDARGLEPPQPLVIILEAVESLPQNAEIHARTDRKPIHLYDELQRRGFSGQTEERPGEGFLILIRRK